MTVASTTNTAGPFSCNGSVTEFSFNFKTIESASDNDYIQVRKITVADGSQEVLTENTDYTLALTNGGEDGGVVTISPALSSEYEILIQRVVDLDQETDFENQGGFYPNVHEDSFDKLTMITQQLDETLDRCVKVNPGEDVPDDYLGDCQAAQAAAELAQTGAETAETNAEAHEAACLGYRNECEDFRDECESIAGFNPTTTTVFVRAEGSVDQAVTGVKTFSTTPRVPAAAPTLDAETANKKYVDDQIAAIPSDFVRAFYDVQAAIAPGVNSGTQGRLFVLPFFTERGATYETKQEDGVQSWNEGSEGAVPATVRSYTTETDTTNFSGDVHTLTTPNIPGAKWEVLLDVMFTPSSATNDLTVGVFKSGDTSSGWVGSERRTNMAASEQSVSCRRVVGSGDLIMPGIIIANSAFTVTMKYIRMTVKRIF
jgi:hypothetical protein